MKLVISDIENINSAAEEFIKLIAEKKVIAFYGAMGAGKTTFIKAVCEKLGVRENVNSPTFAIINVYNTSEGTEIYHMDCYRINTDKDAENLDLSSYFYSGNLCFIEWPENIEKYLPDHCVKVSITVEKDNSRIISF